MWTPGQARSSRSNSMRSLSRSMISSSPSTYEGSIHEDQEFPLPPQTQLWSAQAKQQSNVQVDELNFGFERRESLSSQLSDGDTLEVALDIPEHEMDELDPKTPTANRLLPKVLDDEDCSTHNSVPLEPTGPLSQLLLSALSHITQMERSEPTILASDYQAISDRLTALEKKHQALYALRDEDVENNISIRCQLAKERREHEAMKKLRDEDLENVYKLREKLAAANRQLEKAGSGVAGTHTPLIARSPTMTSNRLSRVDSDNLWQAAKTMAMEQRVLELEAANKALKARCEIAEARAMVRQQARELAIGKALDGPSAVLPVVEAGVKAENERLKAENRQLKAQSEIDAARNKVRQQAEEWKLEHAVLQPSLVVVPPQPTPPPAVSAPLLAMSTNTAATSSSEPDMTDTAAIRLRSKLSTLRAEKQALARQVDMLEDRNMDLEVQLDVLKLRASRAGVIY